MSPALIRLRSHSGVVEDTPAAGSLVSPATLVNLNENYASSEPEVSSTSCCSRNSKSLDLDENGMEVIVASKEK
ncbi:hypothetical protein RND71_039850 [Anisodus tanguticus]|uniref:Uncharacterized protein n=1 Tax=Anisodus tanguticus TaxID=243964 RepID=A0AAE1UXZ0_9SOLA|nr:hypothetical protein RND71_039850 [Anisodus tanguticus]